MKHKLTTNEAAALAADEYLGASNFGETVATAAPGYTPGPYHMEEAPVGFFNVCGGDGKQIVWSRSKADADRIAYCLNIVEESEKTDRVA